MGNKLYNIEIKKSSCQKSIFDYPCETVADSLLQGRKIYLVGAREKFAELVSLLSSNATMVDSVGDATDIIILPNAKRANTSTSEGYYNELAYYHDVCCGYFTPSYDNVRNMVVLLPPHSTEFSTHYSQMADYATAWYINGLSKYGARKGKFVYGIELSDDVCQQSLFQIILYLLSSNSNHMVCDIIKLDR